VVAADERADAATEGIPAGVDVRLGGPLPDPGGFDLVVPSPGVPRERYAERARRVWGDVELAFRALEVPIAAVTGTNGKSTTVRLLEAMLGAAGLRARAAGNVGVPALSLVGAPLDVAVLEVSSFQLETVDTFRPRVGVLLNVSPDHLDRHGDAARYLAAKLRCFARQGEGDVAVVSADPALDEAVAGLATPVWRFGRAPQMPGACFDGAAICLDLGDGARRLPLDGLPQPTGTLRENTLAALLAACALGADPARALDALDGFAQLPHRCEPVAQAAGVRWIDDSKATNPGAAVAALRGETGPVIWIAGGRDKGLDFAALREAPLDRVKRALLIGEAAAALGVALDGAAPVEEVGTLEHAVERAAALAEAGDAVLLSPACASFDQFAGFEERGRRFAELARDAAEGRSR
jgi:UDP-N-acetylmuramoylalanine--D-glutamate ligase